MADIALSTVCSNGPGGHQCCGFYCGPGWCGNEYVLEESGRCNFNHPVAGSHTPTGLITGAPSDTDTCCQAHDRCCGTRWDTSGCNGEMVRCFGIAGIANTVNGGLDCTRGGFPVATQVILASTYEVTESQLQVQWTRLTGVVFDSSRRSDKCRGARVVLWCTVCLDGSAAQVHCVVCSGVVYAAGHARGGRTDPRARRSIAGASAHADGLALRGLPAGSAGC